MTAGLLDTSVVIDWHDPLVVAALPDEMAISAVTAAELTAGPLLATTSTAHANGLDLYTRNGDDFSGLHGLVRVVAL